MRYLVTAILALATSCPQSAWGAPEDPLAAVAEQAATLAAAPRMAEGERSFTAEELAGGAFVWIEVAEDGYYTLTLSSPGTLVLGSIPTADGGYDGKTKAQQHASSMTLDNAPSIGPLLLGAGYPYLLSASAKEAATLALKRSGPVPTVAATPEQNTPFSAGEVTWRPDGRIRLVLAASAQPVKIEVSSEPRVKLDARIGGELVIPPGGAWPWAHDQEAALTIDAAVPAGTPSPLVHLRVTPAPGELDESEPNETVPDALSVGDDFKGVLLARGDHDTFALTLDASADLELSVDTGLAWARFEASLADATSDRNQRLWNRKPAAGSLEKQRLALDAGDYLLALERKDGRDEAVPYTLRLAPAAAPDRNREIEPNDTREAAMPMPESLRVAGSATPDDLDLFRFTVPDDKAQHLWRVFTTDAQRIEVTSEGGKLADVRATGRRSTVDALALTPGDYWVTVHAEGDYLLRVMDLGPRPSDYEGEPNDSFADGQRLEFGAGVRGGFHRENDLDHYLFRLDAASPVEIEIRPPGDGRMDVKLYQGGRQVGMQIAFAPGDGPYTFRSTLPADDWAMVFRALDASIQEHYEVSVERLAALAGNEPDDDSLDAVKLPRDGDLADSVGAFDGVDQVFLPLPEGEGTAALICEQDSAAASGRWSVHRWSDASRLGDIRSGLLIFPYGPELGGAVRFALQGNQTKIGYACALRFPPADAAPAAQPAPPPGDAPAPFAPGETLRATVTAEGPEPRFALVMDEGDVGFILCRSADGDVLEPDTRVWGLQGTSSPTRGPFGETTPFVAGAEPLLTLHRSHAQRYAEGALPLEVDCTLYTAGELPRPADMGPPAEFRLVEAPTADAPEGAPPAAGPPPPGLEALLAREAPERQPEGDLPVTLEVDALPELAGFAEAGQRFTLGATLTSAAESDLQVTVSANIPGDGWRVEPRLQRLSLQPGVPTRVTAEVAAPPWLAPALRPGAVFEVKSGAAFAATLTEIPVSVSALPVDPFVYWHAPDALRGGLNVLHYGLGARLTDWGGQAADEKLQSGESGLHDGLAPHIDGINAPLDIAFRLAAEADVAGVMIQLRSTTGTERWPAEVEVFAPDGSAGWRRLTAAPLASIHAPQYLVFDAPVTTDRLRFVFPRCNASCSQAYLQEIQAIAVPGMHPGGLAPINAADFGLGGHVVWSGKHLGGHWNADFLKAVPEQSNGGWSGKPHRFETVVAFHQNRAALLDAVAWVGDPDDTARAPGVMVDASLAGPNGPWTPLGNLAAPPIGEDRSLLRFDEPVWARYLRFGFDMPEDGRHLGPDAIEAIEAPGTSVLALWEDDQPRAAYEAAVDTGLPAPVAPAGGADRAAAVPLPIGSPVVSSVVIERNEDWWRIVVPDGPPHALQLAFERTRPVVVAELFDAAGDAVTLDPVSGERVLEAVLMPGEYALRIFEPPRSVVISWDTSGSVSHYIPRTLAAVRTWGRSLQPGRDALQLLPFGPKGFLLEDFAETPDALEPALRELPEEKSSDSEKAMQDAAKALAKRRGARGIVIMTDAETGMEDGLWTVLLEAMPRVVSLSVDSDSRQNAAVMMDWAALNGGRFQRVIGPLGLADGMEMANALFRAPKAYRLTATLEELIEPEGELELTIAAASDAGPAASGAVELILDASGSMLQRMEGRRRIDVAHDALTRLVHETLPAGTLFAFRAFGLEEDACRSELVVPLGPLDRDAAAAAIEGVPAVNLAKTAIAASLRAAVDDLADASAPRVVVLVTDGEETCEGDPEAAIAELRASGLDARVNIVGFAIDDEALAATFSAWAEAGGGAYFDASGADALERSIADALRPRFDITRSYLDGRSEVVGRAALGETVIVPAGRLTVAPGSAASGEPLTLEAIPGKAIQLNYSPAAGLSEHAADSAD